MSSPADTGDDGSGSLVRVVAFAVLLLIDAVVVCLLGVTMFNSLAGGGGIVDGASGIFAILLFAFVGCMAGAYVLARRGRFGTAMAIAAIPAALSALAVAGLFYLLSNMGPHH